VHDFRSESPGNLDEADRVYNGINEMIDKYIARTQVSAPQKPEDRADWPASR
jgi:hypothetical protein